MAKPEIEHIPLNWLQVIFMRRLLFFILILSVLFNQSCQQDIDLFIESPTEAIAYALINPRDTIHIVRVQKTYVTEI